MRTNAMSEINVAHNLARLDIDDDEIAAIAARFADAGITVDGNVSQLSIRRSDHFVPCISALRNGCYCLAGIWIDDAERLIALVGHEQNAARRGRRSHARRNNQN